VKVFREYTQAELDAQYEQRAWAPNADEVIRRYGAATEAARERLGLPRTEPYGKTAAETLDIYGDLRSGAPALVFVHGGAWRRMSKREGGFAAETFVRAPAAYVALDFALLPTVTLAEMVDQVCRGVSWVCERTERVVLCGHSSGAHLAACALLRVHGIRAALLVSGIYDLLPVRLSARNDYVRVDDAAEQAFSPIRHVERIGCPVTLAWAEHDNAEFTRQSREFAAALGVPGIVVPGTNHFEAIETLTDPRSLLAQAGLGLLKS
jgi:arylformamidase